MRSKLLRFTRNLHRLALRLLLNLALRPAVLVDRLFGRRWVSIARTQRGYDDLCDLELVLTGTRLMGHVWLWSQPPLRWGTRTYVGPMKRERAERLMDADERRLYDGLLEGRR